MTESSPVELEDERCKEDKVSMCGCTRTRSKYTKHIRFNMLIGAIEELVNKLVVSTFHTVIDKYYIMFQLFTTILVGGDLLNYFTHSSVLVSINVMAGGSTEECVDLAARFDEANSEASSSLISTKVFPSIP